MPKLTVITRKAYGGAYDVMSSKVRSSRTGIVILKDQPEPLGCHGTCWSGYLARSATHHADGAMQRRLSRCRAPTARASLGPLIAHSNSTSGGTPTSRGLRARWQ